MISAHLYVKFKKSNGYYVLAFTLLQHRGRNLGFDTDYIVVCGFDQNSLKQKYAVTPKVI